MKFDINSIIFEDARTIVFHRGHHLPLEYSGSKSEYLACRETAWLGVHLSCSPVYDVFGPDMVKLFNQVFVNRDFSKMKIDGTRHGIICNDKGQILADGVVYKIEEQRLRTYWLAPVLQYFVENSDLDVQGEYVSDQEYFFQIDGPKSLEILEEACQCDLHDLKFAQNKHVTIGGTEMTVHRLGMSGALAYEVHGAAENAMIAYSRIREVLEKFGGKALGYKNYNTMNHTPGGYPNQWIHYANPWYTSGEGLAKFFEKQANPMKFAGSASENVENLFVSPYDIGWGYLVNFDHDFMGKEALQKLAENPYRKVVTLEWNTEDVGEVFMSQFRGKDVEPYDEIDYMNYFADASYAGTVRGDYVLVNGKIIGMASGRTTALYERRMISLGFIDNEYADEGTELIVLWGTPGHPQKEIRVKVTQFPYFNEEYRNETFDVSQIPRFTSK